MLEIVPPLNWVCKQLAEFDAIHVFEPDREHEVMWGDKLDCWCMPVTSSSSDGCTIVVHREGFEC
jgi:hypothetical protein